jgi:hypothetical protein
MPSHLNCTICSAAVTARTFALCDGGCLEINAVAGVPFAFPAKVAQRPLSRDLSPLRVDGALTGISG